jgi:predicted amidohydrolase
VGGIQRREGEARPANCLFVVSDRGQVTGRYDERMLSRTKAAFMYAPGSAPLVFTVNGLRFGCALGMETHYAELFLAYEELGADCVLFSTAGDPGSPGVFAIEAAGHAAANSLWVSYAGPAQEDHAPAGLLTPEGTWAARCATHDADLAIAEITGGAAAAAREWRRVSRAATGARPGPT